MVSLYKLLEDKYGFYYVSYGKKHRLKTLDKNKIDYKIIKLFNNENDKYIVFK